jgi:hypothetical protein
MGRFHKFYHRTHEFHRPPIPWVWINILTIFFVPLIASFVLWYVPMNSVGKYFSIALFLVAMFFTGRATWYLLKKINSINLMSDLALWLLRIMSVALVIFSVLFFFSSSMSAMLNRPSNSYSLYAFDILLFAAFIIGVFGIFRFKRRHHIVGVWQ